MAAGPSDAEIQSAIAGKVIFHAIKKLLFKLFDKVDG